MENKDIKVGDVIKITPKSLDSDDTFSYLRCMGNLGAMNGFHKVIEIKSLFSGSTSHIIRYDGKYIQLYDFEIEKIESDLIEALYG